MTELGLQPRAKTADATAVQPNPGEAPTLAPFSTAANHCLSVTRAAGPCGGTVISKKESESLRTLVLSNKARTWCTRHNSASGAREKRISGARPGLFEAKITLE